MTKFGKLCFVITCLSTPLLIAQDQKASSQSHRLPSAPLDSSTDGMNQPSPTL